MNESIESGLVDNREILTGDCAGVILRRLSFYPKGGGTVPTKPKRSCRYPGCPDLSNGLYCEKHKKLTDAQYNKYQRDPETRKRYGGEWRKIRGRYIKAHPLCEECLTQGLYTPAQEVHHILPLSHGGGNAAENLMALCKPCHSRITVEMGDRWHDR